MVTLAHRRPLWSVVAYCAAPLLLFAGGEGGGNTRSRRLLINAALRAINGGSISGTDLTIKTGVNSSNTHHAVYIDTGSTITLTGSNTTITGTPSDHLPYGVNVQGGSSFVMTDGTIDRFKYAVNLDTDSTAMLTNGSVFEAAVNFDSTSSNSSLSMTGGSITSTEYAVRVAGSNNQATLSNVAFNSHGSGFSTLISIGSTSAQAVNTLTINGGTSIVHTGKSNSILSVGSNGLLVLDDVTAVSTGSNAALVTSTLTSVFARVDAQNFSFQTATPEAVYISGNSVVNLTDRQHHHPQRQ